MVSSRHFIIFPRMCWQQWRLTPFMVTQGTYSCGGFSAWVCKAFWCISWFPRSPVMQLFNFSVLSWGSYSCTHYRRHMVGNKDTSKERRVHQSGSMWLKGTWTHRTDFLTLSAALMISVEDSIQNIIGKAMSVMFSKQVWEEEGTRQQHICIIFMSNTQVWTDLCSGSLSSEESHTQAPLLLYACDRDELGHCAHPIFVKLLI